MALSEIVVRVESNDHTNNNAKLEPSSIMKGYLMFPTHATVYNEIPLVFSRLIDANNNNNNNKQLYTFQCHFNLTLAFSFDIYNAMIKLEFLIPISSHSRIQCNVTYQEIDIEESLNVLQQHATAVPTSIGKKSRRVGRWYLGETLAKTTESWCVCHINSNVSHTLTNLT